MPPKVLLGCPTAEYKQYCLKEYLDAITNLSYENYHILIVDNSPSDHYKKIIEKQLNKRNTKNIPSLVIKDTFLDHAKDRIVHSRNIIREHAIKENYDYLFSLEQDVIPPQNIIEQLLSHKKHITSGLYFTEYEIKNKIEVHPLVWVKDASGALTFINPQLLKTNKLIRIHASGLGCVMLKRTILQQIPFRLFDDRSTFDDMPFYYDLFMNKIPVFLDTSMKCKHLIKGMHWEILKE